jgi:hypothetical protein
MLEIDQRQLDAFDRAARESFEQEMVAHVKTFAPKHATALGDEGCLKVVRFGMERAETHGFTLRGPTRFVIELVIKFGSGFDTDLQLPWASAALADKSVSDEMARADRLYAAHLPYDEAVIGPGGQYAHAAAVRSAGLKPEVLDVSAGQNRTALMLAKMKEYYPEKAAAVGDPTLARLLPLGMARAAKYAITSDRGGMLFAVLMFVFGHQFDTDPRLPWIAGTLTADRADTPDRRAERMATKSLAYAARAIA